MKIVPSKYIVDENIMKKQRWNKSMAFSIDEVFNIKIIPVMPDYFQTMTATLFHFRNTRKCPAFTSAIVTWPGNTNQVERVDLDSYLKPSHNVDIAYCKQKR